MNRNAKIAIVDDSGRNVKSIPLCTAPKIKLKDGDRVGGAKLVEWDPYSLTILTETGGRLPTATFSKGVTMKEEFDEVTGFVSKVIIRQSGATLRPRSFDQGRWWENRQGFWCRSAVATICLPVGYPHFRGKEGAMVHPGDVLARFLVKPRDQRTSPEVFRV